MNKRNTWYIKHYPIGSLFLAIKVVIVLVYFFLFIPNLNVNLISESNNEWERDPEVQDKLQRSAKTAAGIKR